MTREFFMSKVFLVFALAMAMLVPASTAKAEVCEYGLCLQQAMYEAVVCRPACKKQEKKCLSSGGTEEECDGQLEVCEAACYYAIRKAYNSCNPCDGMECDLPPQHCEGGILTTYAGVECIGDSTCSLAGGCSAFAECVEESVETDCESGICNEAGDDCWVDPCEDMLCEGYTECVEGVLMVTSSECVEGACVETTIEQPCPGGICLPDGLACDPCALDIWLNIEPVGYLEYNYSTAIDVNDAGEVVGTAKVDSTQYRAYHLSADGVMTPLVMPEEGNRSYGWAINASGQIGGSARTAAGTSSPVYSMYWSDPLDPFLAPYQLFTKKSEVFGLSNVGDAAGISFPSTKGHPTVWEGGYKYELPFPSLPLTANPDGVARAFNNVGCIAGDADGQTPTQIKNLALLWCRSGDEWPGPIVIGAYNGDHAEAHALNDSNEVVGWTKNGGFEHAFHWKDGVMKILPPLPLETNSHAQAISEGGLVGGWSKEEETGNQEAVLWAGAGCPAVRVTTMIPPFSGWDEVRTVEGISPDGLHIVGNGIFDGIETGWVATVQK